MIKKGLKVVVLTGKDKKKEGEVIEIDRPNKRAKVKEINMVKKHVKLLKKKKVELYQKKVLFIYPTLNWLMKKLQKKQRLKNNDSKIKRNL